MQDKTLIVKCPHCGTQVTWTEQQRWRPFCSERCRLIDLGAWADESHRLPGEADEPAEFIDETQFPQDSSTQPTRN